MTDATSFVCATCGARHESASGFSFDAPDHYAGLTPEEQRTIAELGPDTCVIAATDHFVRGCLEIPVHGQSDPFVWGVWVTLSPINFVRYAETLGRDTAAEGPYFGWFSNQLPGYPDTLNLKTNVHFRSGRLRPAIELEPTSHPLAVHQRDGIAPEAFQKLLGACLHRVR